MLRLTLYNRKWFVYIDPLAIAAVSKSDEHESREILFHNGTSSIEVEEDIITILQMRATWIEADPKPLYVYLNDENAISYGEP